MLTQLIEILSNIVQQLLLLVSLFAQFAFVYGLLIAWIAWWLLGVNWSKAWLVLAQGAWIAVVLVVVVSALVWSQIMPASKCLGFTSIPNFWWQLCLTSSIAGLALFCGWLQGYKGWTPIEISLEPPAPAPHDLHHGHH